MTPTIVAFLFNMITGSMLAPNQPMPRDNGLPIIYQCDQYPHSTIDPQTFAVTITTGYRNCVAIREMTVPEYMDWRDEQKRAGPGQ